MAAGASCPRIQEVLALHRGHVALAVLVLGSQMVLGCPGLLVASRDVLLSWCAGGGRLAWVFPEQGAEKSRW